MQIRSLALSHHGNISRATHHHRTTRTTGLQPSRVSHIELEHHYKQVKAPTSNSDAGVLPLQVAATENEHQSDTSSEQCSTSYELQSTQQDAGSYNRRQLLEVGFAAALVSAVNSLQPPPAVAAGAATTAARCDLQTSASGLQWCDLVVGDGANPIKGAFTK